MDDRGRLPPSPTRVPNPRRAGRAIHRLSFAIESRLPRGAGIMAASALLLATLGYGVVKGGHADWVSAQFSEARDGDRQHHRLSHRFDRADRPEAAHARGNSRHCRRDRTFVAAVPQRRRRSHPAEGQSVDRGRDRAQAVSRPAAYRDHRTACLRALAEETAGCGWSRATASWSSPSSPRMSRICRWSSARAPMSRLPIFFR